MTDTITVATRRRSRRDHSQRVDSRQFALADLGCAVTAGALWYLSDGALGPWPLLIAGVPWAVRIAKGRFPIPRTRFDWLMWTFLLSAGISASLSYAQENAWAKFWLIVGATAIFYALAGQRAVNVWPIVIGIGVFAVAVATYFLLTHDWQASPAKIDSLNNMALTWMRFRPDWFAGVHQLHPNVAGGIIAMLFPLSFAGGIRATRDWHRAAMVPTVGGGFLLSASLVLTASRGAWLALLAGLIAWVIWIGAGRLDQMLFLTRRQTLALCFATLAGIGITLVLLIPGGLVGVLDRLPGPANAGSRLSISRDALDLIGDFPLLGAGLGSFDGLYSQYIRVIPNHFLIHGHNLYLNVGVEQGIVGMLMLLGLIGSAFWWLSDPVHSHPRRSLARRSLLSGALFASLVVVCVHGLVEDPLYGSRGALLLWLPLGLTAVLFPRPVSQSAKAGRFNRVALVAAGLAIVVLAAFIALNRASLLSRIASSRGAVEMARVELAQYPMNAWSDGHEAPQLAAAEARFAEALALDPTNRTAWHRLGLIAMLRRDYAAARDLLAEAHRLDPEHRGILKSLAYSDIWSGEIDAGVGLMANVPEAYSELGVYIWWWGTQNAPELSLRAEEALSKLTPDAVIP